MAPRSQPVLSVAIDADFKARVAERARRDGISVSEFVRLVVGESLKITTLRSIGAPRYCVRIVGGEPCGKRLRPGQRRYCALCAVYAARAQARDRRRRAA